MYSVRAPKKAQPAPCVATGSIRLHFRSVFLDFVLDSVQTPSPLRPDITREHDRSRAAGLLLSPTVCVRVCVCEK